MVPRHDKLEIKIVIKIWDYFVPRNDKLEVQIVIKIWDYFVPHYDKLEIKIVITKVHQNIGLLRASQ